MPAKRAVSDDHDAVDPRESKKLKPDSPQKSAQSKDKKRRRKRKKKQSIVVESNPRTPAFPASPAAVPIPLSGKPATKNAFPPAPQSRVDASVVADATESLPVSPHFFWSFHVLICDLRWLPPLQKKLNPPLSSPRSLLPPRAWPFHS